MKITYGDTFVDYPKYRAPPRCCLVFGRIAGLQAAEHAGQREIASEAKAT